MKARHRELLTELETIFSKEVVSFSTYRSAILALRRCHSLLEDLLPYAPHEKQNDARIYLKILGDMQNDVSLYADIGFLEEFVRPAEDPYPNTYSLMNDDAKESSNDKRND